MCGLLGIKMNTNTAQNRLKNAKIFKVESTGKSYNTRELTRAKLFQILHAVRPPEGDSIEKFGSKPDYEAHLQKSRIESSRENRFNNITNQMSRKITDE
jgi:hypothetical protein